MRVLMLAFHTVPKGPELKPGDIHDGFDDAEAQRQIAIGGARELTDAEAKTADDAAAADKAAADKIAADKAAAAAAAAAAKK